MSCIQVLSFIDLLWLSHGNVVKYKDQLSGIKLHVNQIQDKGDIVTVELC